MQELPDENAMAEVEKELGRELTVEEKKLLFRLQLRRANNNHEEFDRDLLWISRTLWIVAMTSVIFLFTILTIGVIIPMWVLFAARWDEIIATGLIVGGMGFGFLIVFAVVLALRKRREN